MKELRKQEAEMSKGILDFVAVCESLISIRNERLFQGDHETFEDYLKAKFGDESEMAALSLEFYEEHLSK